ncbi:type IV toxin-antitoxin system AbiEi family antitoxin domain-containing protein [Paraburkholderia oxyphila]|uniref:type IV toxin-antitoxin system AbiEi family antitoxin domain-containing protein n=1 Tax=Paraburkholderia oxyphila TaxID=614212 RepID=UPI000AF7DF9C
MLVAITHRASRPGTWREPELVHALFDGNLPEGFTISPLPNRDPSILVAEPERALLELASDVGKRLAKGQSLEEAINIASSLRNLRPKVLDTLLSHCTRVKVVKRVRDPGESSGFALGPGSATPCRQAGSRKTLDRQPQGHASIETEGVKRSFPASHEQMNDPYPYTPAIINTEPARKAGD